MENLKEGFRFHPTDREAISFLLRFISGEVMNDCGFITTHLDTYSKQLDPWEIYSQGVACGNDDGEDDCSQYRYFITKLKKKSESRYSRNVGKKGCWKQNLSKAVRKNGGAIIGYKKSMSYVNKSYDRQNGHWLMKEYELSAKILDNDRRDYVFCAIKKRTPKNLASQQRPNSSEHQTPVAAESTSYHDTLQGVMHTNLQHQSSTALSESTSYDEALQGGGVMHLECTNLQHQSSAALSESTSFYEALQGEELQSNSLDLLDFDYEYLPADFDCLRRITALFG